VWGKEEDWLYCGTVELRLKFKISAKDTSMSLFKSLTMKQHGNLVASMVTQMQLNEWKLGVYFELSSNATGTMGGGGRF
jgi:hypothetical protein